jgi:hypothetical protein
MTKLLKRAFAEASKLSDVEQNAIAKWLLEELTAEKRWDEAFANSEDALDQLADKALEEHKKGKTVPLDADRL